MASNKRSNEMEDNLAKQQPQDDDSDEEESKILEESPCGRWSKRSHEVQQRDVPGIEAAYLAMDTEEGMEVVWNEFEIQLGESGHFREQELKIQQVFNSLSQLDHPNIVKLHKYWIDVNENKRRVIFITEYMSSGSLKKFLKVTNKNVKKLPLNSWRRWCIQILSALSYLHSCSPSIIHGNITTDSIFIQHNGLVKIGSVAPDAIQTHVKATRTNRKNMHYVAPEYTNRGAVTSAVDIYSFGICALEMAAVEIPGNGDSGHAVTKEQIMKTLDTIEHPQQADFIRKCLSTSPSKRPSATDLLFHPVLFEVPSLKLQSAHRIIDDPKLGKILEKSLENKLRSQDRGLVVAVLRKGSSRLEYRLEDVPAADQLEKFVEDVKYGIYPLTIFKPSQPLSRTRPLSPELVSSSVSKAQEQLKPETRRITNMMCSSRFTESRQSISFTISLRLEDKMNRQLSTELPLHVSSVTLADELVQYAFINPVDRDKVAACIDAELRRLLSGGGPSSPAISPEMNGDVHAAPIMPLVTS